MKRRLLVAATLAIASLASWGSGACTIVNGLSVPRPDAGPESGAPEAGSDAGDGCQHAYPPPPPTNAPSGGDGELLVAIKEVFLGSTRRPDVAYDLDHLCTCAPHGPSCSPRQGAKPSCDDPGGRDNVGGLLARNLSETTGTLLGRNVSLEDNLNRLIKGGNGFIIRVQGYNGGPDDPDVAVAFYPGARFVEPGPDGGIVFGTPKLDGTDRWAPEQALLVDGGSRYTTRGYVSGGTLVTTPPLDVIVRVSDTVQIRLNDALITARVTFAPDGPHIESGAITGRWPIVDVIRNLAELPNPLDNNRELCKSPELMQAVLAMVCPAADIPQHSDVDQTSAPCDAISTSLGFDAVPAQLRPPIDTQVQPSPCDAGVPTCP